MLPPQQRIDEHWYKGTADAIYQNIYTIEKADPKYVLILAGDHIYKMDYGDMIRAHLEQGRRPDRRLHPGAAAARRSQFGVMQVDDDDRIIGFQEKPQEPTPMPGDPDHVPGLDGHLRLHGPAHVRTALPGRHPARQRPRFRQEHHSAHDRAAQVYAFRFRDKNRKATPYWRDVGTLDAYYQANMDLIDVDPVLNLYDRDWPIRTLPAAAAAAEVRLPRRGDASRPPRRSARQHGLPGLHHLAAATSRKSILSPNVPRQQLLAGGGVRSCSSGVDVGRHCRIRRAIIDKDVKIPPDTTIGYDLDHDRRRGFTDHRAGRRRHRQGGAAGNLQRTQIMTQTPAPAPKRNRGWLWYFLILVILTVAATVGLAWYNLSQQLRPEQFEAAWEQMEAERLPGLHAHLSDQKPGRPRRSVHRQSATRFSGRSHGQWPG